MPELPEVETTRCGLVPLLVGRRIHDAVVRHRGLRRPVPAALPRVLRGAVISDIARRGKYLLFDCGCGTLILHLGMSGRLWVVGPDKAPETHDHFDLVMQGGVTVRLRDPRRFGLLLWHAGDPLRHPLLAAIGPEPLSADFDGSYLYGAARNRRAAIKLVLMDSHVVAGVGNIYANEALFRAGINPRLPAHRIGEARCGRLAAAVSETLQDAIAAGGSSLRDYVGSDGMAGNFQNQFLVYGRAGEPCRRCGIPVRSFQQGQRSTYCCPACQRR